MKIAANEIQKRISNGQRFYDDEATKSLGQAIATYAEKNKLSNADLKEFYDATHEFYNGLGSVGMKSAGEFAELNTDVINNPHLTDQQAVKLTVGFVYNSDGQLRSILNIAANVALGEAAGGIGARVGNEPVGPRITSNEPTINPEVQRTIVNRRILSQVPENINVGQQGKHIVGHNNYRPGRSVLTANPNDLLKQFHDNETTILRQPNANRIIVDFHRPIGTYVNPEKGISAPTTRGAINFGRNGAHIVPSAPQ